MYKVIKVYKGGVIKLPANIREELRFGEGDELVTKVDGGRLILVPRKSFDPVEAHASMLGTKVDEDELFEEGIKESRRMLTKISHRRTTL